MSTQPAPPAAVGRHRSTHRPMLGWALLGVVASAALVLLGTTLAGSPTPVAAAATTPPPAPSTTTSSAQPSQLLPEPTELPSTVLAAQTCGRIADEPTTAGVWDAAAALEVGPAALPVQQAWAFVDLAVRLDCPEHTVLVTTTIAEVTA